jgi:hypothetical protein
MKKLFFLALLAFAGWYGWNHRDTLFQRKAGHEAVVENHTGQAIQRVRVVVDGQTLVRQDPLEDGASVTLPFQIANDSDFQVTFLWVSRPGEMTWRGGSIARGPMLQRHVFQVMEDGSVLYRAESKGVGAGAAAGGS